MDESKKETKVNKDDALKLALNLFPNHSVGLSPPEPSSKLPSFRDRGELSDTFPNVSVSKPSTLPNLSVNKPTILPNLIVDRKNKKIEQKVTPNLPIKPIEEKPKNKPAGETGLKQTMGVFRGGYSNISPVRYSRMPEMSDLNLGRERGMKSMKGENHEVISTKHDNILSSLEIGNTEDFPNLPIPLRYVEDCVPHETTSQQHDPEKNFLSIITEKGNEKPPIMLIKFPQFLPLLISKKEDTECKRTFVNGLDGNSALSGYRANLKDLSPGQIGKVIVHKSGKAVLKLGDCSFLLETAISTSFAEEVAKVDVDPELKCGNVFNLGKVSHRLVAIPDFTNVLTKKESKMESSEPKN